MKDENKKEIKKIWNKIFEMCEVIGAMSKAQMTLHERIKLLEKTKFND